MNQYLSRFKAYYSTHKRVVLIAGLSFLIIIVGSLVLLLPTSSSTNPNVAQTPSPTSSAPAQGTANKRVENNPLISNDEVKRVEDGYKKQYEQAGKVYPEKPEHKFNYKLSPSLQGKSSSFLPIQSVFAAGGCSVTTAPSTVPVYALKSHWSQNDAQLVAEAFGVGGSPASVPMGDGSSFQYYFADQMTTKFLTVAEPSGTYYYHQAKVPTPSGATSVTAAQAKTAADQMLGKHELSDNSTLFNSGVSGNTGDYVFKYIKEYDGLKMVNESALASLTSASGICNIDPTKTLTSVEVHVNKQGQVTKVINNSKKVLSTSKIASQSLAESMKEYGHTPPIPPIVIGGNGAAAQAGDVTVEQSTLVYYNYENDYAQVSYVPMYLTSGKTNTGLQVITLFPAATQDELSKTPIPELNHSNKLLQLETFNPEPSKMPPPPSAGGGMCYGGAVDYTITCTAGGARVCKTYFEGETDPMGACQKGCQTKQGVITVAAGQDACAAFSQQNGVKPKDEERTGGRNFNGGEVSCSMNACPC